MYVCVRVRVWGRRSWEERGKKELKENERRNENEKRKKKKE